MEKVTRTLSLTGMFLMAGCTALDALVTRTMIEDHVPECWELILVYEVDVACRRQLEMDDDDASAIVDANWPTIYRQIVRDLGDDPSALNNLGADLQEYVKAVSENDWCGADSRSRANARLKHHLGLPASLESVCKNVASIACGDLPDHFDELITGYVLNLVGKGELDVDFLQRADRIVFIGLGGHYQDWLFPTVDFPIRRDGDFFRQPRAEFRAVTSPYFFLSMAPGAREYPARHILRSQKIKLKVRQSLSRTALTQDRRSASTRPPWLPMTMIVVPMWDKRGQMVWAGEAWIDGRSSPLARFCTYEKPAAQPQTPTGESGELSAPGLSGDRRTAPGATAAGRPITRR